MSIRSHLLEQHSRANADRILAMVLDNLDLLPELMACFFSDEITVAQRASQVVGDLGRQEPSLLLPWLEELVEATEKPVHQAIRRNAVRYFSELDEPIPSELETKMINLCGPFVSDPEVPTAIGAFAMQFIAVRADRYPTAAFKLCDDLRKRMPTASAGFQNRGRKLLKMLEPDD
ncbi:MAG: hypothetical protein AB8B55_08155 [Mariniblastus sp.]